MTETPNIKVESDTGRKQMVTEIRVIRNGKQKKLWAENRLGRFLREKFVEPKKEDFRIECLGCGFTEEQFIFLWSRLNGEIKIPFITGRWSDHLIFKDKI